MRRRITSTVIRSLVGIAFIALTTRYVYMQRDEFSAFLHIQWWDVAKLTASMLVFAVFSAIRFQRLYLALGIRMGFLESFGLSRVAIALNMMLPAHAGTVAKAMYMKKRHSLPYSKTPVILLASVVISLFIGAILILITNLVNVLLGNHVPSFIWLGAVGVLPVLLLLIRFPDRMITRLGRFGKMLRLFEEGLLELRTNRKHLLEAVLCQLTLYFIGAIAIMFAFASIGLSIDIQIALVLVVFNSIMNLVNITPGNLGLKEAAFGYISEMSGLTFTQGVAASVLTRVAGLLITFISAPIAWYFLFHRMNVTLSDLRTRSRE